MADNLSPQAGTSQPPVGRKVPVWFWMLIGCGGLGFLLVIAGIIAAIAIPSLRASRRTSLEPIGAVSIRSYVTAQTMYIKTDWDGDGKRQYAADLNDLNIDRVTGKRVGLIPPAFAGAHGLAGQPFNGYMFQECKTIGGQPIDWTTDFALCAIPAAYGGSGYKTFIISTDGRAYEKDLGRGGTFVDDFPADPKAAGWDDTDGGGTETE